MSAPYVRQPKIGDIIEVHVGAVIVTKVHDHGRRIVVLDRLGRDWLLERAIKGTWLRVDVDFDALAVLLDRVSTRKV